MAFIRYVPAADVPPEHQLPDSDSILRIHGIHSAVGRHHYDLYRELMLLPGSLTRVQREMVAVVVSATNGCHY